MAVVAQPVVTTQPGGNAQPAGEVSGPRGSALKLGSRAPGSQGLEHGWRAPLTRSALTALPGGQVTPPPLTAQPEVADPSMLVWLQAVVIKQVLAGFVAGLGEEREVCGGATVGRGLADRERRRPRRSFFRKGLASCRRCATPWRLSPATRRVLRASRSSCTAPSASVRGRDRSPDDNWMSEVAQCPSPTDNLPGPTRGCLQARARARENLRLYGCCLLSHPSTR